VVNEEIVPILVFRVFAFRELTDALFVLIEPSAIPVPRAFIYEVVKEEIVPSRALSEETEALLVLIEPSAAPVPRAFIYEVVKEEIEPTCVLSEEIEALPVLIEPGLGKVPRLFIYALVNEEIVPVAEEICEVLMVFVLIPAAVNPVVVKFGAVNSDVPELYANPEAVSRLPVVLKLA